MSTGQPQVVGTDLESEPHGEVERRQHVEFVVALMKEYTDKLTAHTARVFDLIDRRSRLSSSYGKALLPEANWLVSARGAISPRVETLARFASQILEHYGLGRLVFLEVKLRLDELEQALDSAELAIQALSAHFPQLKTAEKAGTT